MVATFVTMGEEPVGERRRGRLVVVEAQDVAAGGEADRLVEDRLQVAGRPDVADDRADE